MKPKFFLIEMYPTVSFRDEKVLCRLLDVLESYEAFAPTHWGNSETVKVEYNREELLQKVMEQGMISEIYLYRNKSVRYTFSCDVNSSRDSFLEMEFSQSIPKKLWSDFFALSDQLAGVAKPRYGLAHMFWASSNPWTTERERVHKWMNICAQPIPVRFLRNGPLGLGMKTYMDHSISGLLDSNVLKELPARVTDLDWGGVSVSLLDNPLEADLDTVLDDWRAAMNHLEKVDFLATPQFDEKRQHISFTPSKAWNRYLSDGRWK
ncbi:hypothetical protein [Priestia koreensis]|uniref:hypothetical protein n=1 Tax=Priestia koreensis TaxID=284581 RepID=UPI003018E6D5